MLVRRHRCAAEFCTKRICTFAHILTGTLLLRESIIWSAITKSNDRTVPLAFYLLPFASCLVPVACCLLPLASRVTRYPHRNLVCTRREVKSRYVCMLPDALCRSAKLSRLIFGNAAEPHAVRQQPSFYEERNSCGSKSNWLSNSRAGLILWWRSGSFLAYLNIRATYQMYTE